MSCFKELYATVLLQTPALTSLQLEVAFVFVGEADSGSFPGRAGMKRFTGWYLKPVFLCFQVHGLAFCRFAGPGL